MPRLMLWVLTRTVRCAEARYSILMKPSLRAKEGATEEVSMNGPDDQAAARLRRRLIERLNTKENERSKSQGERPQHSNQELQIEDRE